MPVAAWSKEVVCNRLTAGIEGSNLADGMDIRTWHSSVVHIAASATGWALVQGNAIGCACLIVCYLQTSTIRRPRSASGCRPPPPAPKLLCVSFIKYNYFNFFGASQSWRRRPLASFTCMFIRLSFRTTPIFVKFYTGWFYSNVLKNFEFR
jgi:hypothetical protein